MSFTLNSVVQKSDDMELEENPVDVTSEQLDVHLTNDDDSDG